MQYNLTWIAFEVFAAIICVILVRFMIVPYRLTGEGRYLGLPLGFGILGLSYIITLFSFIEPFRYTLPITWLIHLTRTFAFVFFAMTYYFSNKSLKKTRILSNLILSLLIIILMTLSLFLVIIPEVSRYNYENAQLFIRIIGIICLVYVSACTLRIYSKNQELASIWIPIGFILLAVNQLLLLLWYFDFEVFYLWGGLTLRSLGLAVFLLVSYQTFYRPRKKAKND
jgi:hypothetical protein